MNIIDLARDIVNYQLLVLDEELGFENPSIQETDIRNDIRLPDDGECPDPPELEDDATGVAR